MAENDPKQPNLTNGAAKVATNTDADPKAAKAAASKPAPNTRLLTADRWNEIKSGRFNPKTEETVGGLLNPESNTQELWHKNIRAMLEHIGKDVPEGFPKRHKEISDMLTKAALRRNPVHQGRGEWFKALVDLFEMAKPPEGAEAPTEEEILNAREPDDIRAELAARYDQRKKADELAGNPEAVENK